MTYPTHVAGGFLFGVTACALMAVERVDTAAALVALSVVSSGIPDVDSAESKLGRKVPRLSKYVEDTFGHRGILHTPVVYLFLVLVTSTLIPAVLWQGFLLGILSHLVLDTFNRMGVAWLYPITRRRFHIAEIRTRSSAEVIFRRVTWVISILPLFVVVARCF